MTKRSKLALVVLLASFAGINASAQKKPAAAKPKAASTTTAKPTKQETMDWIAGKMKENLAFPRNFVSYKDGVITYSKEMGGGGISKLCTTALDLNKITGLSNEFSSDFYISGKGISVSQCTDDAYPSPKDYVSIAGPNFNEYGAPFDFTVDNSLVERMRKALTTLVEYNSAKKAAGEKF